MNKTAYRLPQISLVALLGLLFFTFLARPLMAQGPPPPPFPHLVFHAELGGEEVIPAVNTAGKGLVTFILTPDRKKAELSGMLVKLEGTVTEAKIRLAVAGQTGPEIFDLLPYINDRHIIGSIDMPAGLLSKLLVDGVYVEVKTTANPNGEIRGQFVCETDLDFMTLFTGDQAVPANNSTAVAFGGIHYPLGARDLVYAFTFRGINKDSIIFAGIYDQANNFVASTNKYGGGLLQGLILLDTIDPDFLRKAREGEYHVVIKTIQYPNGEIQGKIEHVGYFASYSPVNSVQQVPPPFPPTGAFGFNRTKINGTLDTFTTTVFINKSIPTSVKIHFGFPGEIGPEFQTLEPMAIPGFYFKKYPITEAQLTDFVNGRMYINMTSAAFPNGELRGVMKNTLRKAYAFDLCGIQVVPPSTSNALGVAVASVDQANCYLNYKLITDGLNGLPVEGYFAANATQGQNGVPFHALNNTAPMIVGAHEIMSILGPTIERDSAYIQINTPGFLGGEIRGQVRRGFTCPEVVAVNEIEDIKQVNVSPVPFQDVLNINLESISSFEGRLVMHDLLGGRVLTQTVQVIDGEQSIELQTGELPKGVYLLSLEVPSQQRSMFLKKVVRVD